LGSPVDLEAALAWVDGDRGLLEELLAVFREECPVQLRALRAAVEAADGPLVRRLAHTVKGSVASLGAARARDLAETLEHLGQAGTLDRAPGALAGLEAELARVLACLAGPRPGTGA
jgi:HPt (histidine-containing phosphotransfer) domain-containing protein